MKKFILLLAFCSSVMAIQAQTEIKTQYFLKDANGTDLKTQSAVNIQSDFLFKSDYLKAALYSKTGKITGDFTYKLNLQENRIYYVDPNNTELEVMTPVRRIEFELGNDTKAIFEKGFPLVGQLDQNNFYQVLVEGKLWLLLDTKFIATSKTEYGGGTVNGFDKLTNYYLFNGTSIAKVTKPEQLMEFMADQSAAITAFIKQENIKAKKQADLEKVCKYYNSLNR